MPFDADSKYAWDIQDSSSLMVPIKSYKLKEIRLIFRDEVKPI